MEIILHNACSLKDFCCVFKLPVCAHMCIIVVKNMLILWKPTIKLCSKEIKYVLIIVMYKWWMKGFYLCGGMLRGMMTSMVDMWYNV